MEVNSNVPKVPIDLETFIQNYSKDSLQLSQKQAQVAQLSQSIIFQPSPEKEELFKKNVSLLEEYTTKFEKDIKKLKEISSDDNLAKKIHQLTKRDIFTVLDDSRSLLSNAKNRLQEAITQHQNLLSAEERKVKDETKILSEEPMRPASLTKEEPMRPASFNDETDFLLWAVENSEHLQQQDFEILRRIALNNPSLLFRSDFGIQSFFKQFMGKPNAHEIFDHLMAAINPDEVFKNLKEGASQIMAFAFSTDRYERSFAQDKNLSREMQNKSDEIYNQYKNENLLELIDQNLNSLDQWFLDRMATSNSLTHPYVNRDDLRQKWMNAEAYCRDVARRHRGTETRFEISTLQLMHKKLAAGDPEIPNPGKTRNLLNKPSASGGTWMNNYCAPSALGNRLEEFEDWVNKEISKCNSKEKNPLILAAQTYQRVVSLHPFENGNGRLARLAMDYILMRYDIAPCVMKDEPIAPIFPLMPTSTINPEKLYNTMLDKFLDSSKIFTSIIKK